MSKIEMILAGSKFNYRGEFITLPQDAEYEDVVVLNTDKGQERYIYFTEWVKYWPVEEY